LGLSSASIVRRSCATLTQRSISSGLNRSPAGSPALREPLAEEGFNEFLPGGEGDFPFNVGEELKVDLNEEVFRELDSLFDIANDLFGTGHG